MSLYTELAGAAFELLDDYGQDLIISRPSGAYDPNTRSLSETPAITQTLKGTLEPQRGQRSNDSLAQKFDRIAIASPTVIAGTAFEPRVGDTVDDDGQIWVIGDDGVKIEKRQGVAILYTLGLNAA